MVIKNSGSISTYLLWMLTFHFLVKRSGLVKFRTFSAVFTKCDLVKMFVRSGHLNSYYWQCFPLVDIVTNVWTLPFFCVWVVRDVWSCCVCLKQCLICNPKANLFLLAYTQIFDFRIFSYLLYDIYLNGERWDTLDYHLSFVARAK